MTNERKHFHFLDHFDGKSQNAIGLFTIGDTHCVNSPTLVAAMNLINLMFITSAPEGSDEFADLMTQLVVLNEVLTTNPITVTNHQWKVIKLSSCNNKMYAILMEHGRQGSTYFSS